MVGRATGVGYFGRQRPAPTIRAAAHMLLSFVNLPSSEGSVPKSAGVPTLRNNSTGGKPLRVEMRLIWLEERRGWAGRQNGVHLTSL